MAGKSERAFRTIGELADDLGVPQHILRYWETRFVQLKPLQRAGNRRYYRPEDVALARRIHRLLNEEGYTIRGVQRVLGERDEAVELPWDDDSADLKAASRSDAAPTLPLQELTNIRTLLIEALRDSQV